MSLLAQTCAALDALGVAHAVIGAAALAAHGVTRATADLDLLATDARCLDGAVWTSLTATGCAVDIRRGDAADPLAGVVRVTAADEAPIDLIVGRARWQEDILRRAARADVAGVNVPIVLPADLILLKLYAGGTQDAWDIDQLLDAAPGIARDVAAEVGQLPPECAALWRRIIRRRPPA